MRWQPPVAGGFRLVRALAVDNEPAPFWTGEDQVDRITQWREVRNWRDEWGTVQSVPDLNGPSGQWVRDNILRRFGVDRSAVWITDCLDTYRASTRMQAPVQDLYRPFAEARGFAGG